VLTIGCRLATMTLTWFSSPHRSTASARGYTGLST